MNWLALLAVAGLLQGGATARSTGVRAGYAVEPETVYVGQPATLRIRVLAPAGARITFPSAVDSTSGVEPLDPVTVHEETKDGVLESVALYRFLAWEIGLPQISIAPIRVDVDGRTQELRLGDPRVFVVSVLPADTALRVPKPSRGIVLLLASHWKSWTMGMIVLGAGAAAVWWLRRRRRAGAAPIEPFADAQRAFGRLSALDLIGAGEPAKHVAAAVDVLRNFLARRDQSASPGLTTPELLRALGADGAVPTRRVVALLTAADAIKFAAEPVDAPVAEALGAEAASIAAEVHRADARAGAPTAKVAR